MCYTLFQNHQLSDSQKEKFVAAVNANTSKYDDSFLKGFATFMENQNIRLRISGDHTPLMLYRGSESKKTPILGSRSVVQSSSGLSSASYFVGKLAHRHLFLKYESLYGPVCKGLDLQIDARRMRGLNFAECDILGGEVHFLQEPGLKLRAIASPFLVHQLALGPLGRTLFSHLRALPWDCTHDHSKPVSLLQTHLASGQQVHSVDLSNATDYFPLEIQLRALTALCGKHPSIDLFSEVSRSTWKSTIGPICWKQGQPLGLYPSFASFGMTHGYLLAYLLGKKYNNEFFVLGDDVVILDDALYQRYMQTLDYLGCPYSPDKSLSSSELCEFAGKVITSKRVIASYKWREVSNDNFLDLVRNYGRKAVALLTPIQKEVVERIQHLVEPIGLNWSFEGSTLEEMTRITQTVYRQVDRDEQSLTGLQETANRNWYSVPGSMRKFLSFCLKTSVDNEVISQEVKAFDEKAVAVLQQILPNELVGTFVGRKSFIGGYAGVPRAVGNTDLPLEQETPSRVTTLDRYRKLLNLK